MRHAVLPLLVLWLAGCASCERPMPTSTHGQTPLRAPVIAPALPLASYELHEWGLVRGNLADHVVLSGPRRAPTPIPIAKPVLYVHRRGEGPLSLDVEVTLSSGAMVEHWPLVSGASGDSLAWRGVSVEAGHCASVRYPSLGEAPCNTLTGADGCEAAELATVETNDGDCLVYGGERWASLFYRGELSAPPSFPIEVTPGSEGSARVTVLRPIVGRLVRVRDGVASAFDATVGQSIELSSGAPVRGAEVLGSALSEAGLTDDEVAAFRRAWDPTLFPSTVASTTTTPTTAAPVAGGLFLARSRDTLLYVLSAADADQLSTLRLTPAPTRVSRAIVVWLDLGSGHGAYEPPY
ncbi:MAG: hypothetical protein K1X94_03535 [Sandaracinaceae bacterium]|nr:hypothetical protein [Sandaracinaceae bacterium]